MNEVKFEMAPPVAVIKTTHMHEPKEVPTKVMKKGKCGALIRATTTKKEHTKAVITYTPTPPVAEVKHANTKCHYTPSPKKSEKTVDTVTILSDTAKDKKPVFTEGSHSPKYINTEEKMHDCSHEEPEDSKYILSL